MFAFEDGCLTIRKVTIPKTINTHVNILDDLQKSYSNYLQTTIHEDMKFLSEEIKKIKGLEKFDLRVKVGELKCTEYMKTDVVPGVYYYPVWGYFYLEGQHIGHESEMLRIPYMNDYGYINVNGAWKAVLMQQRSSEDISYDVKKHMLNIAMPHANIRIYATRSAIKVAYGATKQIPIEEIISSMLNRDGITDANVKSFVASTYLLTCFKNVSELTFNEYVDESLKHQVNIVDNFLSEQYKLGSTREAINNNFTLYRACGYKLSRPLLGYPVGTIVTDAIVREAIKNRINIIYVQVDNIIEGYRLARDHNQILSTYIKAGTKVTDYYEMYHPRAVLEHSENGIFFEDADVSDNPIMLADGMPITPGLMQLLEEYGVKEQQILVHAGNSSTTTILSFEREIIGNATARLGDLIDGEIPAGRRADEWVYYYNNPNLERRDDSHLTPFDLLAMVSLLGEIHTTGQTALLNRDTAFLKKSLLIGDTFSETLRFVMRNFVNKYKSNISNRITKPDDGTVFVGLTSDWIKEMLDRRVLAAPKNVNLAAEVAQVNSVATILPSDSEVVDEQRHIAMPFYGRICAYETPAGKKLGLNTTKAVGAKYENGMLLAPFRKVFPIGSGNKITGIRISDNITWLSVKDELSIKLGDILSLKKDENGNYLNTPIMVRIANPEVSNYPFIVTMMNAFDLATDPTGNTGEGYVQAWPEQFLSPTANMMPFACSDNAVRLSYGIAQFEQAVYLLHSQVPYVRTDMYKDIFNYSTEVAYKSPVSGTVIEITNTCMHIKPDSGGPLEKVRLQHNEHIGSLYYTPEFFVHQNDHVNAGDSLFVLHKYAQPFIIEAPCDGTVIDITDKCIYFTKRQVFSMAYPRGAEVKVTPNSYVHTGEPLYSCNGKDVTADADYRVFTVTQTEIIMRKSQGQWKSPGYFEASGQDTTGVIFEDNDSDVIEYQSIRVSGQAITFLNLHCYVGMPFKKGQILADTLASRGGIYCPGRQPLVAYISVGYNYEDGICATERACTDFTSVIHTSIPKSVNIMKARYPRVTINKSFKYRGAGHKASTLIYSSRKAQNERITEPILATIKENGIPFEVTSTRESEVVYKYNTHLIGLNRMGEGDKMSGRHGNKGVVSRVLKDSQAPQLLNGKTVELILSPCGVPSRMNIGQIYDAMLGLVAHILQIDIKTEAFNCASKEEIEKIMLYTWMLANTEAIDKMDGSPRNRAAFDAVCRSFPEIPKEVHDLAWQHMDNILDWRGAFNRDGSATLYDPETDSFYENPILIGYPTMLKLEQEGKLKINARSGVLDEQYARTTSQPQDIKNDHNSKGQRMAEMELVAYAAHGCSALIDETLNEKSDNVGRRDNMHCKQLGLPQRIDSHLCASRAVENLLYYFEAMGVKMEVPTDVADVSHSASLAKTSINVKTVATRYLNANKEDKKEVDVSDLSQFIEK